MSRSGQTFISLLAALRQRLSQLDWVPVAEHEHTLILAGDFNAAEGLLLPERLQEAQALLGATALLACTPKRGVLLVAPMRPTIKRVSCRG